MIVDRGSGSRTILFNIARWSTSPRTTWIAPSSARVACSRSITMLWMPRRERSRWRIGAGAAVVSDIEDITLPGARTALALVDHAIMGRRTGASLTGRQMPEDMVQALAVEPKPCWAVTDGERGVWYSATGRAPPLVPGSHRV